MSFPLGRLIEKKEGKKLKMIEEERKRFHMQKLINLAMIRGVDSDAH